MPENQELFRTDSETAVLSILLKAPNRAYELMNLKNFMFSSTPNQALYSTIQELMAQNLVPEVNLIDSYLKSKGRDLQVGGRDYLNYLYKQPYKEDNLKEFERLVVNSYKARSLISLSATIPDIVKGTNDINSSIENLRTHLDNLTKESGGEQTSKFEAVLKTSWDNLLERVKNPGIRGISTSYTSIDISTSGMCGGELWFIAGRPGQGKTALMCNFMVGQGKKAIPTLIFSLEMTKNNLVERMLAIESEVPSSNIRLGTLTKDQIEKISNKIKEIKEYPIYIDANYSADLDYIISTIRRYVLNHNVKIVYVDYIQLLAERNTDSTNELGKISRAFKRLANELGITIIVGSQLNRLLEARPDKRPILSDMRQSGNLEEDADVVIGLYRDSLYHPNAKDKSTMEAIILKQRNGPIGTIPLTFLDEYTKVLDRL